MQTTTKQPVRGHVLRGHAKYYDWLVRLMTLFAGQSYTTALLKIAQLRPGETVLDLGCGTGTLALECAREMSERGQVFGIDASDEMLARARRKVRGERVQFLTGTVEALPFENQTFDAVFSTLMLHHLPKPAREACLREARRVIRPGGRLIVCDFQTPSHKATGLSSRLHRHGSVPGEQVAEMIQAAGFHIVETGMVGVQNLHFTLAKPE